MAQIEMSLSTVLVGEYWADDGDCDEPDGDRPDERVAAIWLRSRIKVAEAATLMGLGRRQVFRLAKAYGQRGPRRWCRAGAAGRAIAAIRRLCGLK